MERHRPLDVAGRARPLLALKTLAPTLPGPALPSPALQRLALLAVAMLGLGAAPCAAAQCAPSPPDPALGQLFDQQNWSAIVKRAASTPARSPELNFDDGMALAHLGRLPEARSAFLAGLHQCPSDVRFPEELAGLAFQQKRYPEAAHWLRRALRLNPHDTYAVNFLGAVDYLAGNLPAALDAWNRIGKPSVANIDLDPHLRVRHLLLDRAFAFAPASVLQESQFTATEARLDGLGIFPAYSLQLSALPGGSFNAVFRAQERDGFGSGRLAAAISALSGLPYETIYPSYANIHRDAMNFDSLLRWDSQKRRVWLSLSAPPGRLPRWRWHISMDGRGEHWAIRRSFTGTAPILGSLHLEREEFAFGLTSFSTGRLRWDVGGDLSHRAFTSVVPGTALTSSLVTPGYEAEVPAFIEYKLPVLPERDLPQHRFTLSTSATSAFGRTLATPTHSFENLQGSALAHWLPSLVRDRWDLRQQLRAGKIFGTVPFDNLYLFGMDRDDTDLWLRGHIATRDGRKGSAPIGNEYLLSNSDLLRRLYGNGLLAIHAGPLLDIGRMTAPTTGLSAGQWLVDTGVEARVTVLHTSVVLSYGRDLRSGANAFYGTANGTGALPTGLPPSLR